MIRALPLIAALVALAGCGGPADRGTLGSSGFAEPGAQFASTRKESNTVASAFWDIAQLKQAPRAEWGEETVEKTSTGDVVVREVRYDVPASGIDKIRAFAYYAYPAAREGQKLPAMVWVHGGASIADRKSIIDWASRGYAAIGMDLPGKGGEARAKSRSEGPDMSDKLIFTVTPSAKSSYLYLCVNSVCRAISLLREQKEVDPSRIGVIGYSWGGVITLLANGIDDRISAACTVYGAGYIPDESIWSAGECANLSANEKKTWREHFDPSSYLGSQHGKMLFIGATQDIYYPLRSFARTYQGAECPKALYIALNKNHQLDEAGERAIPRWFDWALRSGPALPTIKLKKAKDGFEVRAKGSEPVVAVDVATTESTDYTKAEWSRSEVKGSGSVWKLAAPKPSCLVFVADDTGGVATEVVSVSGKAQDAAK